MKELPVAVMRRDEEDSLSTFKSLFYLLEPLELNYRLDPFFPEPGHPQKLEEHYAQVLEDPDSNPLALGGAEAFSESPLKVLYCGLPVALQDAAAERAEN